MNNSRALIIIILMFVFFIALTVKLFKIQIVQNEEYKYYAERQQTDIEVIKAEQGLIYDRNNVLLVYNRQDVSFYADLRMINNKVKNDIANLFSRELGKSKRYYLNLMQGNKKTICIEKKVLSEKAKKLKEIKYSGFFFREEPTRVFHYDNFASHVLGYVDHENKGVSGISEQFFKVLKGTDGSRLVEKNALGSIVTVEDEKFEPAVSGNNIYLTIDKSYQIILEEELSKGLSEYGGTSATGIIMDPNTGEILALSNLDDFNPNQYWKFNDFQRRNRAVTDTYEPGSTFKTITLSALLDQKLCRLNEKINVENGRYKFKSANIRDTHPFKVLSVTDILTESSNIGFAKLIQRMDDESYYKYLRGFGFGNITSIPLPGETPGLLRKPNEWSGLSKTYLSFGYEISVTPLQLISAYSAVINGGILYEPQLINRQVDADGNLVNEIKPKEVRRVISSETSATMRELLSKVVKNGTGKKAYSNLIPIGGKTGTSQKLVNGAYSKEQYNSSFIGFFPVDDPKVVCLILINSPDQGKYGGLVAAPIFKSVAERIIKSNFGIFENDIDPEKLNDLKFASNVNETEDQINQFEFKEARIYSRDKMPDLINCSLRDAILTLTKYGIKYKVEGNGIITSQSIRPGTSIDESDVCILKCSEVFVKGVLN